MMLKWHDTQEKNTILNEIKKVIPEIINEVAKEARKILLVTKREKISVTNKSTFPQAETATP
eukprot:3867474-Ditylum_brightwellii.AAC.1